MPDERGEIADCQTENYRRNHGNQEVAQQTQNRRSSSVPKAVRSQQTAGDALPYTSGIHAPQGELDGRGRAIENGAGYPSQQDSGYYVCHNTSIGPQRARVAQIRGVKSRFGLETDLTGPFGASWTE
jgi:hypothetical protein